MDLSGAPHVSQAESALCRCAGASGSRAMGRDQLTIQDGVVLSTPADGAAREAGQPDEGGQGIPERHEEHMEPDAALAQTKLPDKQGQREAHEEIAAKEAPG